MKVSYKGLMASVPRPAPRMSQVAGPGGNRFWRVEDPVLSPDREVIKGGMWEYQRQWWDLPNFIKLLVGGYGAGKTIIGAKRAISLALENAPVAVAVVSPTYKVARETMVLTIKELLTGKRDLLGKRFKWRYFKQRDEFEIRYKGRFARILLYSGDRPETLKGPNLAAAVIDEPFIQPEEVFHQMVARVRHPKAKRLEIALTGTPEELNWGYDLAVGDLSKRHDVGMVVASTRKNRALDPGYVERLEASYTGRAAEAFIDGKFVSLAQGQVYYAFDPGENVVRRQAPSDAQWGIGMDFNVNPMAFVVFWKWRDTIHFVREYELPNADTEYACSVAREHWGNRVNDVYPDASGRQRHTNAPGGVSDFYYIRRAQYQIHCGEANPPVRDRENAVNAVFKAANGRVRGTVDPDCEKLIKYLSLYNHENKHKKEQQAMSHLLDAMGYPIARLFPVNKEVTKVKRLHGA